MAPECERRLLELLGEKPLRRDLLIEYLHAIQDAEGCLPAALIAALAIWAINRARGRDMTLDWLDRAKAR